MIQINSQPTSDATINSQDSGSKDLKSAVGRCIGGDLEQVEKLIRAATASRQAEVAHLCRSAAAMGGKRLRPTLVWLAARAIAGGRLDHRAARDLASIAAAVELVHAASLVHDDVMDGATQRRHQPTIVGQSGNSAAVLLGDLLFTRAYALAAGCRGTYPARSIAAASTRLCEGELRQQVAVGEWSMSHSKYRSLLLQKTGALCAVSCRLGGWRASGSTTQTRGLAKFGSLLGLAFQIYDDWLDYWGTEQVGKTLGTDLAQAKPTLPLIRLLHTTPTEQQGELIELLNDPSPDARYTVRKKLNASDSGAYTLHIARLCCDRAQRHLEFLPPSEARDCLTTVAQYSVRREG